jgi:hypothetical protein
MARRKKSHAKRHHTRRRHSRMSGMGGNLTSVLYIAGGAVLAQALGKAVGTALTSSTMSATTKNLINGAIPVVAGIFTPKFIKGDVGAKLGAGMIAVGGLKLVQSAGILNGMAGIGASYYGNKPVRNIAGYQGASAGTYIAGVRNAAVMEHC